MIAFGEATMTTEFRDTGITNIQGCASAHALNAILEIIYLIFSNCGNAVVPTIGCVGRGDMQGAGPRKQGREHTA